MPSTTRRSLLGAIGTVTVGSLAGCSTPRLGRDGPPSGSLGFANLDRLPHTLGVHVIDAPETYTVDGDLRGVPPAQRSLRSSVSLRPDETLLVPEAFTEAVQYHVGFTVDGRPPEHAEEVSFNPYRDGGTYLYLRVDEGGDATWVISAAGTSGPF
ncbi:hypothetical protein [Halomarina pelagica]|uniref:hypothetical protein n=1 Tax=Halomarina pelagica TaxID=2961599 RepID=UPI0020C4EA8A|nr:hypothetical protein [Halomarina sp. BND7]